ncbi:MAG TPA: hypothetical protein VLB44_14545 [Kofleriaceae bacterium]|nr:hypothetical protein [Kofleriaceae bacterium]
MIEGLPLLEPGHIVWFGEMHGTEESPRFVGDVVEQAAAAAATSRHRVQLGLEIAADEQAAIDRYLGDGDRRALIEGPFWHGQDGRSTPAMVALIERVRTLRATVSIVAFDARADGDPDRAMADAVMRARDPEALFIGLSGNIHSRRTRWNDITPLVAHLVAAGLPVTTYNVVSAGGTFWGCVSRGPGEPVCGEHRNFADRDASPAWTLGPARDDSHDGVYFVGVTKASPPLRSR